MAEAALARGQAGAAEIRSSLAGVARCPVSPGPLGVAPLISEDVHIASDTPGISLFVRNRRLAGIEDFGPTRTLLMMHGSSFASGVVFDLRCDGFSWMDYVAAHGFDVYAVDVRGYGGSIRPPEAGEPVARSGTAIGDVV